MHYRTNSVFKLVLCIHQWCGLNWVSTLHTDLGLDHSLGNTAHGVGEPTLKAFGKITDGLSQGTLGFKLEGI